MCACVCVFVHGGGSAGRICRPSCNEDLTDAVVTATVKAGTFSSVWETQTTTGTGPGPRMGHVAVIAEAPAGAIGVGTNVDAMYVIAGQTCNTCTDCYQNDVHYLDLAHWTWTKLNPTGTLPRKRYGPTGWWNAHQGGVQITGGTHALLDAALLAPGLGWCFCLCDAVFGAKGALVCEHAYCRTDGALVCENTYYLSRACVIVIVYVAMATSTWGLI